MQNIHNIPISLTIVWFLIAYDGLLSSSYIELILRVLAVALCLLFYFKKYLIVIFLIIISIFLLPITRLGLSLSSYLNIDFFIGGVLCIAILAYAHIILRDGYKIYKI